MLPRCGRFISPNGCYRSPSLIAFDVRDSYGIGAEGERGRAATQKVLTSAALLTRASIKTANVVAIKHASLRFSVGILFDCIVILAGDGYRRIGVPNKEECENIGKGRRARRLTSSNSFSVDAILSVPSVYMHFTISTH